MKKPKKPKKRMFRRPKGRKTKPPRLFTRARKRRTGHGTRRGTKAEPDIVEHHDGFSTERG